MKPIIEIKNQNRGIWEIPVNELTEIKKQAIKKAFDEVLPKELEVNKKGGYDLSKNIDCIIKIKQNLKNYLKNI